MKQSLNMSNVLCFMLFVVGNNEYDCSVSQMSGKELVVSYKTNKSARIKGEEIWENPARRTHRPTIQTISPVEEQHSTPDHEDEVPKENMAEKEVYFRGTKSVSSVTENTVTSQAGSLAFEYRSGLLAAVINNTTTMKVASAPNRNLIFNYEGAVFSSAVALFHLMMNGSLISKAHLSSEKEKPLSPNQPLLSSGNSGLVEPAHGLITPLSTYIGTSTPPISILRSSAADSLADSSDAQEEKGKNKSENGISQLFRGSNPLNREPLVPSDEAQLSVTRASTESPVGLTFPHEKGHTESKNIVSLTLQSQFTGSPKKELPPSLTTTSKPQLRATAMFAKTFPAGEEEDIQTNGVDESGGSKALAVTQRMGTALSISSPTTSLTDGPDQDEGEATPSPVLLRSTTRQPLPVTHLFWLFERTREKRKERMSHIYIDNQPQQEITKGPSLLNIQEQMYRTEPQQIPSLPSQTASTSHKKSHSVQTTSGHFVQTTTLATHHTPLNFETKNKHNLPASEEIERNEKDKFIPQSTELMLMKPDLSKFQILHDTLVNHTIPGKEKDMTGVTLTPLNSIFQKAHTQGDLKLGNPDNQIESAEVSVSHFVPVQEKEMLAMACPDCVTSALSAPSQTSFAAALPKVPPLMSITEDPEMFDSLNFEPLQFLEDHTKASTLSPESSHQNLTKAKTVHEKLTPVTQRFTPHPQLTFFTTGNGPYQFDRHIRADIIRKGSIYSQILSQRTESWPVNQTTIRAMREISSSFEKLPVNNTGEIYTPTKSVSSLGSLSAADYNKDRYPTVSSKPLPMNKSISYLLEKNTTSAVKGLVSEGKEAHFPCITSGEHQSTSTTLPVIASTAAILRKTHDGENMDTKENPSLKDGSLAPSKGLKDIKNPNFSQILHAKKATDVSLTPSKPELLQSVLTAVRTAPDSAMRTTSVSVTHRPSELVLVSKHKNNHSTPGIQNNTKSFALALFSLQSQEATIQQEMETDSSFNVKPDTAVDPVSFINAPFKYTSNPLDLVVNSRLSQSTVRADISIGPSEVPLSTAHPRKATTSTSLEKASHFTKPAGHAVQLMTSAYASSEDRESLLDTQPAVTEHTSPRLLKASAERQVLSSMDAMILPPLSEYFAGQTASEDVSLHFFGVHSVAPTDTLKKQDLISVVPQAGSQHSALTSFPDPKSDVKNTPSVSIQPLLEEDSSGSMLHMSLSPLNSTNETDWESHRPLLLQKGSKEEGVFRGKHFIRQRVAGADSQHGIMAQRMHRLSPSYFLRGLADVTDDFCGTGNYTAEMSLSLDSEVLPGDSVPALGNLHVVISLKTNSSQGNLTIKSCCISPSAQPDKPNVTCSLFSRLPFDPRVIRLLPSDLPSSASFNIRLFQMTNFSTAYLHCDLSVCPRNHTDCERCLQHRHLQFEESFGTAFISSGNRISFGPVLKEKEKSTVTDITGLDHSARRTSILGSGLGCLLFLVASLLLWLGYRHKKMKRAWPGDEGGQITSSHWV